MGYSPRGGKELDMAEVAEHTHTPPHFIYLFKIFIGV